jgi:hypothetical protein
VNFLNLSGYFKTGRSSRVFSEVSPTFNIVNFLTTPAQSLRFDTLNITLSYKDSSYCEWYFIIDIFLLKKYHITLPYIF